MRARFARFFLMAALSGACTQLTPEQQIVHDAAEALGGRDRIFAVKTLVIEGTGSNGNLGQDLTPERREQAFALTNYRRAIDVAGSRMRVQQTRTPNFIYFQGPQPQTQIQGVDGEVAYDVAPSGAAARAANATARDRRADLFHHPLTIVRAALQEGATLTNPRPAGTEMVVDVASAGLTFTLAIDSTTRLPTRVVSMTDNPNLGDVAVETAFADYQDAGGLKLPARLTTTTDGVLTREIRVAQQAVDGDTGDLAVPAAAASAPPITGPPPATVTAEEVSKGIWLLAGQSHHSVLVEFADHLTLIEAPQNDVRALAVIAKARELRPGKPLTTLVVTHHHFDHSGGVRAAISEGLTVVAHKSNEAFFKSAAGRPHTLVPDALAVNQKPVTVEPVDEELVLKDASMTLNLYHVTGSEHAGTMLIGYFPRERILVQADLFSPGSPVNLFAGNLLENVMNRQLRVDRIVPIHGPLSTLKELQVAAATPR